MRIVILKSDKYQIVAVFDGDECPAQNFLQNGEVSTKAMRLGLMKMLTTTATNGLGNLPPGWVHEANKPNGIYEYIKGKLRLFFFKGNGKQIVVCTVGTRKSGQKADTGCVNQSIGFKNDYFNAISTGTLTIIEEQENDDC